MQDGEVTAMEEVPVPKKTKAEEVWDEASGKDATTLILVVMGPKGTRVQYLYDNLANLAFCNQGLQAAIHQEMAKIFPIK